MQFVKKPIIVEAYQMTSDQAWEPRAYPQWLANALHSRGVLLFDQGYAHTALPGTPIGKVMTHNGQAELKLNDWIVLDTRGVPYPCDPDIFAETYSPVAN